MKKATWYLKITIAFLLVGYLVNLLGPQSIYWTILRGNADYFLIACLLFPLFIFLKSLKWHLMIRHAGADEKFLISVQAMLIGLGFGLFTPGRAGEIMRVQSYQSIDKVTIGGLVVLDRVIDLITILFLSVFFFLDKVSEFILVCCATANLALLYCLRYLVKFHVILPRNWVSTGLIYQFLVKIGLCSSILSPFKVTLYSGISLTIWIVLMFQFYFLINMYQPCEFKVIFSSFPVIQLSNLLPITVGGIGVRESLAVYIMQPFNIAAQVAVIGAFSLYLIDIAIPGVIGLVLFAVIRN